jgi:hypothetical protein
LIDFGATMGSASNAPNYLWRGHLYDFDPGETMVNILTLGLYIRPWERQEWVNYPSVGHFNAQLFDPMSYKPQMPNPAFQSMTPLDGYWAAKIVMSFTDERIKILLEQGKYSNPEAENYLFETLVRRRDKIGRYFFNRINPLDDFKLQKDHRENLFLTFRDLAVESGFALPERARYRYKVTILSDRNISFKRQDTHHAPKIPLQDVAKYIPHQKIMDPKTQISIAIETRWTNDGPWSTPVVIYLNYLQEKDQYRVLGLTRES